MDCVLEIRDLVKTYRSRDRADFTLEIPFFRLERGEQIALLGTSGSGKSTFLDLLGLASRPDSCGYFSLRLSTGETVQIEELWQRRALDRLTTLRCHWAGYVLQHGGLLPFVSNRENVGLPRAMKGLPEDRARLAEIADKLGIAELLDARPPTLSMGQRQRVAITRALLNEPAIVLADEPTSALDPVNAATVFELLMGVVRDLGTALVITSHEWNRVRDAGLEPAGHDIERRDVGIVSRFWHGEAA